MAALYADLRAVTGVPLVNLIWRHFATLPGMLEWVWGVVRPLQVSGVVAAGCAELLGGLRLPLVPVLSKAACDAVGVGAADRAAILALIAEYERGNSGNLVSLLAVRALLEGTQPGGGALPPAQSRPALPASTLPPLPRLPPLDALAPPIQALVLALDQFGRTAPSSAVASLYRHLGHWPGFMALAHTALSPLERDGSLRAAHTDTLERARAIVATRVLPVMSMPPTPDPAGARAVQEALAQFTSQMIGRMVVMGRVLGALLPG